MSVGLRIRVLMYADVMWNRETCCGVGIKRRGKIGGWRGHCKKTNEGTGGNMKGKGHQGTKQGSERGGGARTADGGM